MVALKWIAYLLPAVAAVVVPSLAVHTGREGIWFIGVPAVCIGFLCASKAAIRFSWSLFCEDVKRATRFLILFAGYHVLLTAVLFDFFEELRSRPGFGFSFIYINTVEELLFRATLIPAMEMLERRLFDSVNQKRAVAIAGLAFGLCHIGDVIVAPHPVMRYAAIQNVLVATVIGIFLGNLYARSRNFPSVLTIHWWINIQNDILGLLAYSLLG